MMAVLGWLCIANFGSNGKSSRPDELGIPKFRAEVGKQEHLKVALSPC